MTKKENTKETKEKQNPYLIPGSIVVAGLFMAGALYFAGGGQVGSKIGPTSPDPVPSPDQEINMAPVDEEDHIRGNFDAPVKIVEFSDLECPFCQRVHTTLQQLVDDYDGQVAWIYRHAPLTQLHPKAQREAEASECAAELGGNDAFWDFIDRLYIVTPANNGLLDSQLPEIAEFIGLDSTEFLTCLDSGKYTEKVKNDLADSFASGLQGTPHSVVVGPNGELIPISGAQPYENFKIVIDSLL